VVLGDGLDGPEFSVEQAIQLRNAGITPEYANKLKLVTHRRLTPRSRGGWRTMGDQIRGAHSCFGSDLDVEKLIRCGTTPSARNTQSR
jgi:hypothetical protein